MFAKINYTYFDKYSRSSRSFSELLTLTLVLSVVVYEKLVGLLAWYHNVFSVAMRYLKQLKYLKMYNKWFNFRPAIYEKRQNLGTTASKEKKHFVC